MKFKEAVKRLKKLANGEHCSLGYEFTANTATERDSAECRVYIHGFEHHTRGTWKEALESISREVAGEQPQPSVDKKEWPQDEA